MKNTTTTQTTQNKNNDYMHGAAIIDDKGKETPITEEMIQKAIKNILKATRS
ncbi:MAG: hypothetical protein HWE18_13910 [Gammaproteobacteria bacterium]|nr:hypothetical protein [Gammaproteobacteria bacterium]